MAGVLLGRQKDDGTLVVERLLLPQQTGEANSCAETSVGGEQMSTAALEHDALTLGWIHTHPSQTCFMSSLDLHSQGGYQWYLAEAISVVVSLKEARPHVGIFRLTTPEPTRPELNGLEEVSWRT